MRYCVGQMHPERVFFAVVLPRAMNSPIDRDTDRCRRTGCDAVRPGSFECTAGRNRHTESHTAVRLRYDNALAGKRRIEMSFVGELKRRNVVRVGIAYVVIGWVLAQIAEFAFDNFGAPDWVLKSFVVFLLLGLPIVLIFAWAFEVTPEGIKREKDVDRSDSITPRTGRKIDYLIIGVLIVAVAILGFDKLTGRSADTSASNETQLIAVLPFVNMSGDEDYFADGLTEELLNLLAKNLDLKVAGRTSSFAFKGQNDDLRAIGNALGVAKVLEGSVRRSGERLRVTAQLINVEDGFHIWSETYDRKLADVFDIQDEVAGDVPLDEFRLDRNHTSRTVTGLCSRYACA